MAGPRVDVTIGADVRGFAAGMKKANEALRRFLTLGAIVAFTRQSVQMARAMGNLADRSRVSVEWLEKMGFAAQQTGSSIQDVADAVVKLRVAQAAALGGDKGRTRDFGALGIGMEELKSLSPEQLFERIAGSVKKTGGGLGEVASAMRIMGERSQALIPGMVEGFDDLAAAAERLGIVLSDETIRKLEATGNQFEAMAMKLRVLTAGAIDFAYWVPSLVKWLSPAGTVWRFGKKLWDGKGLKAALAETAKESASPWENMTDEMASEMLAMDLIAERRKRALAASAAAGSVPSSGGDRSYSIPSADALTKIGLYAGGSPGSSGRAAVKLLQKSVLELQAIHRAVATNTSVMRDAF